MRNTFRYGFLFLLVFTLVTCKKKTSISIKLFNPLIQEYVSNAEIVLIEKKGDGGGGVLSGNSSCKEIATIVTDANGGCFFDKEKLRTNKNYEYFCAVKKSWGIEQTYSCDGKASGFIDVGKSNDIIVTDDVDGYFKIQYNNLFNPAQLGDSLSAIPERLVFNNPKGGTVGGGGINGGSIFAYSTSNNYPPVVTQNDFQMLSGIIIIRVRKIKLGVLTTYIDTIKVYPNQNTIAQINW